MSIAPLVLQQHFLRPLVHIEIDKEDRPDSFQALKIEGLDNVMVQRLNIGLLPEHWTSDMASTQAFGDEWLESKSSLLVEVPSVLVPETWNVLFNPLHPDASSFRIVKIYEHEFDPRLF